MKQSVCDNHLFLRPINQNTIPQVHQYTSILVHQYIYIQELTEIVCPSPRVWRGNYRVKVAGFKSRRPQWGGDVILSTHLSVIMIGHDLQCNRVVWGQVLHLTRITEAAGEERGLAPLCKIIGNMFKLKKKLQIRSLPTHKEPGTSCASLKSLWRVLLYLLVPVTLTETHSLLLSLAPSSLIQYS